MIRRCEAVTNRSAVARRMQTMAYQLHGYKHTHFCRRCSEHLTRYHRMASLDAVHGIYILLSPVGLC